VSHPDAFARGAWREPRAAGGCAVVVVDDAALDAAPDPSTLAAVLRSVASPKGTCVVLHGDGGGDAGAAAVRSALVKLDEARASWSALATAGVVREDSRHDGQPRSNCLFKEALDGTCDVCFAENSDLLAIPQSFLRVGQLSDSAVAGGLASARPREKSNSSNSDSGIDEDNEPPFTLEVLTIACDGDDSGAAATAAAATAIANSSIADEINRVMDFTLADARGEDTSSHSIHGTPQLWPAKQLLVMACSLLVSLTAPAQATPRVAQRVRLHVAANAAARRWLEPRLEMLFSAFAIRAASVDVEILSPAHFVDIDSVNVRPALRTQFLNQKPCSHLSLQAPSLLPDSVQRAMYVDADALFVGVGAAEAIARMVSSTIIYVYVYLT
jgi:hypothetical protein